MALMVQIADPEALIVTVHIGGAYSPDVLDDIKRRVLEMYRETFTYRQVAIGSWQPQEVDEQL